MKHCGHVGCVTRKNDLILVKIRIQMWTRELFDVKSDSSPLRDGAKNAVVPDSMIFQKCIGPDMFSWIRYCVAEVCALPSDLLVFLLL